MYLGCPATHLFLGHDLGALPGMHWGCFRYRHDLSVAAVLLGLK